MSEELKKYKAWELMPEEKVCLAVEVYKAIAELKAKLETVNELVKTSKELYDHAIESLKATHDTEMVDAGMRERRLRRALYKACANWAHEKDDRYYLKYVCISDDARIEYEKWRKMERKCLKNVEEYK